MYEMVTARVPSEIRRQGNAVLKEIGATPTQLVNAAYEYILAKRRLPKTSSDTTSQARFDDGEIVHRRLDSESLRQLEESIERSTLRVPASFWEGASYKDVIAKGRRADYEALA